MRILACIFAVALLGSCTLACPGRDLVAYVQAFKQRCDEFGVAGRVLLPEGADPTRVHVTVTWGSTGTTQCGVEPDGQFSVSPLWFLPEGTGAARLEAVTAFDGRLLRGRLDVSSGQRGLLVPLEEVRKHEATDHEDHPDLLVRVLDMHGRPVEGCEIELKWRNGGSRGQMLSGGEGLCACPTGSDVELTVAVRPSRAERFEAFEVGPLAPKPVIEVRVPRP